MSIIQPVSNLIVAAYNAARSEHAAIYQRWIWMSHRIGSQLSHSLLSNSIQHIGDTDLVCRSMEDDWVTNPPQDGQMDFRLGHLMAFADWWVASAYAVCYTLKVRSILTDDDFLRLANDLRMVRVQNEKYEMPSDQRLDDTVQFVPNVLRDDEIEPPIYTYDKNDRLRAHIARKGMSALGSPMWEVFDPASKASHWLERRELSNRMLDLLSPDTGRINA